MTHRGHSHPTLTHRFTRLPGNDSANARRDAIRSWYRTSDYFRNGTHHVDRQPPLHPLTGYGAEAPHVPLSQGNYLITGYVTHRARATPYDDCPPPPSRACPAAGTAAHPGAACRAGSPERLPLPSGHDAKYLHIGFGIPLCEKRPQFLKCSPLISRASLVVYRDAGAAKSRASPGVARAGPVGRRQARIDRQAPPGPDE